MKKEQFERIDILFEEIFELLECALAKIKNTPIENNDTADAIHMLDKIKGELKI